ncbi:MAG: UMP kinase, partial [Candidatus Komeilibacteria bacterium]|nr:UMP kinase [Candidatus Komeilibacteria bacterium]
MKILELAVLPDIRYNTGMFGRVLLKLSGLAVANTDRQFDFARIRQLADEIKTLRKQGLSLAIVIGGGNIMRGRSIDTAEFDVTTADYMGMLATNINALALSGVMTRAGIDNTVLSPWPEKPLIQKVNRWRIRQAQKEDKVLIFGGGTGSPGHSTDTAAIMRANQFGADILLKATDVDGVYDSDPDENKEAVRFVNLSYRDVIEKKLKVMDEKAFADAAE